MYTYTYCVSGQPQNVDPEFSRNGPGLRQAKGIASKGFRVGQAKHGRRFGDGVYLAEDLAKSLAYCNRGGWTADLEKSWKIPKNGRAWHYNILYSSLFIFIHLYSFICSSIFLFIYLFVFSVFALEKWRGKSAKKMTCHWSPLLKGWLLKAMTAISGRLKVLCLSRAFAYFFTNVPWMFHDFLQSEVPTGTDMSCCAERFVATCTIRSLTAWIASSPRMHTRSWRTLKEIVRGSSLSLTRAMCTLNTLLSSSSKDNSSIWLVVPNNSCSSPMIWAEAHLTSTISCSWHGWSNHQPVINIFCIFGHRVSRNVVAVAPIFKSGVPRVKLVDAVGGWDSEWNAAWIWRGWTQMVKTGTMLCQWLKIIYPKKMASETLTTSHFNPFCVSIGTVSHVVAIVMWFSEPNKSVTRFGHSQRHHHFGKL